MSGKRNLQSWLLISNRGLIEKPLKTAEDISNLPGFAQVAHGIRDGVVVFQSEQRG
jgi:hypothetical protein